MNFDNIISIGDYVYTSLLWRDYHAIDFLQKIGHDIVKIRCPYRTKNAAVVALRQLRKNNSIPLPDYKIEYFKGGELCR